MPIKILCVVGARPNYMKIAPILRGMRAWRDCRPILVHTGQHYDAAMNDVFFQDLKLSEPDISLCVGSGTHAEQTARVMMNFDPVLMRERPKLVVVVGDVNSTLACTLVSVKLGIPVAHIEAGLRSFDRSMPEEINRLVTDALSEFLFTPSEDADLNLLREGIPRARIYKVGNVMVDSLLTALPLVESRCTLRNLGLKAREYGLVTLHRPSNVDTLDALQRLTNLVICVSELLPLVVPLHPRTLSKLEEFNLIAQWQSTERLRILPPQGYLDFIALMNQSTYVMTDSGGVQEETTVLKVPCLTLRPNTERPVTVSLGSNIVVGDQPDIIMHQVHEILAGHGKTGSIPPLWDGHSADRIIQILRQFFEASTGVAPPVAAQLV